MLRTLAIGAAVIALPIIAAAPAAAVEIDPARIVAVVDPGPTCTPPGAKRYGQGGVTFTCERAATGHWLVLSSPAPGMPTNTAIDTDRITGIANTQQQCYDNATTDQAGITVVCIRTATGKWLQVAA